MAKKSKNDLGSVVDRLGAVKAQISDLEGVEKSLRDQLVDSGVTEVEGTLFRATVSQSSVKKVDYAGIVKKLDVMLLETGDSSVIIS